MLTAIASGSSTERPSSGPTTDNQQTVLIPGIFIFLGGGGFPVTGRLERRPNDPMVILLRVRTCHLPKEADPSLSDKAGNSPHLNQDWFYLSGTGLPRLSWKRGRSSLAVVSGILSLSQATPR